MEGQVNLCAPGPVNDPLELNLDGCLGGRLEKPSVSGSRLQMRKRYKGWSSREDGFPEAPEGSLMTSLRTHMGT